MSTSKLILICYQALYKCFNHFGRHFHIDNLVETCNNAIPEFIEVEEGYSIPLL